MEGFRWNITQDNSNEEIAGFKYLILDNKWTMKHEWNCQNDITPPQKIRLKELHFGMQDEECLSSSEKNLDERFEKELNPWWTIM